MAEDITYKGPTAPLNQKTRLLKRWGVMKSERSSWDPHWKLLSQYLLPRSSRFMVQDRNRGAPRHNAIYDNTGTKALRILAAGLMAGMTSPARPWFRLSVPDQEMMKSDAVKVWLSQVTQLMLRICAESNVYRFLHTGYTELGCFGTFANIVSDDFDNVVHGHPLTAGEYALATNFKGDVDTLYREFQKPVGAVVAEFGAENCSLSTRNLYDRGEYDQWVTLYQAVEPRTEYDPRKLDQKNMPFKSCYFEIESLERAKGGMLREGGYRRFPVLAPRWDVTGSDIYGASPGMDALGDLKQLQHEQLRKGQGIDYETKAPVQMPTSMKGQEQGLLPGGVVYGDTATNGGAKSIYQVNLNLEHLLMDIQDVRGRINSAFYADLFLMISQMPDVGKATATEIAERHEEKLLMLGPVLERLHNELLDPLIEIIFDRVLRTGLLPTPPPEMKGMDLTVEYVSMLAQAQRAVATNAVDRFVGNLGAIAQFKPDVLDKFDADTWAEQYSDMLGVDPQLIVPDAKVAVVRKGRAQQQAAASKLAQQESMAKSAALGAKVPTQGGGSNLTADVMNQFSGYNSPSAESY